MDKFSYDELKFSQNFLQNLEKHLKTVLIDKDSKKIDELEFRLGKITNRGFNPKFRMPTFSRIVKKLQEQYPNSPGKKFQPEETYQLDVSLNTRAYPELAKNLKNIRVRIDGQNNINRFCKTNILPFCESITTKDACTEEDCIWNHIDGTCQEPDERRPRVTFESKIALDKVILNDYDLRIQSSTERLVKDQGSIKRLWSMIRDKGYQKFYRYKKRFSWYSKNNKARYDLTIVKEASGVSFELSNVLKAPERYEIELEYLGDINNEDVENNLDQIVNDIHTSVIYPLIFLIKGYQDSLEIISNTDAQEVMTSYGKLIKYPKKPFFIGMDLVALESKDLRPNSKTRKIPVLSKWLTPKADGIRHLVYVYGGEREDLRGRVYLITSLLEVKSTNIISNLPNSLYDSEVVVTYNGKPTILLFDTFFNTDREDIRKLHLGQRLKYINTQIQEGNIEYPNGNKDTYAITQKEYQFLGEPGMSNPLGWNKEYLDRNWEFPLDGLVFTPDGPYQIAKPRSSRRWKEILKWKPINQLSNDFLVTIRKDISGKDIIFTEQEGENEKKYKIADLKAFITQGGRRTMVKFAGAPPFREGIDNIAKLYINLDGSIKTREDKHIIYDNSVIEFIWEGNIPRINSTGGWVPLRFRVDKTDIQKPNHLSTTQSNWLMIVKPITRKMIIGEEDVPKSYYTTVRPNLKKLTDSMRSYHNKIKRELLERSANLVRLNDGENKDNKVRLLDIGSGQGGDVYKWLGDKPEAPLYDYILGLENNLGNLTKHRGAIERYKDLKKTKKTPMKVDFIYGDATRNIINGEAGKVDDFESDIGNDQEKLLTLFSPNNLGSRAFDVVSAQFVVHYFFKESRYLHNFLYNVYQNLKKGGYFIGTTLIGSRVLDLLRDVTFDGSKFGQIGTIKIWEIIKKYYEDIKQDIGQEIDVFHLSISNQANTEYLVYFDFFKEIAGKFGLTLINTPSEKEIFGPFREGMGNFEEVYPEIQEILRDEYNQLVKNSKRKINPISEMTEDEKKYSFLNGFFIFKIDQDNADIEYINKFLMDVDYTKDIIEAELEPLGKSDVETVSESEIKKPKPKIKLKNLENPVKQVKQVLRLPEQKKVIIKKKDLNKK